uniref:Uncharacterized protein n=1 Tax=Anguilla anguilla TaxID=7936 RepID=A0A0E9TEA7_ANGAN
MVSFSTVLLSRSKNSPSFKMNLYLNSQHFN